MLIYNHNRRACHHTYMCVKGFAKHNDQYLYFINDKTETKGKLCNSLIHITLVIFQFGSRWKYTETGENAF